MFKKGRIWERIEGGNSLVKCVQERGNQAKRKRNTASQGNESRVWVTTEENYLWGELEERRISGGTRKGIREGVTLVRGRESHTGGESLPIRNL